MGVPAATARADELVEATKRIIERHGIKGVTYRVVAQEAGIPLGSATYYFPSIDDLLTATIRSTIAANELASRQWFESRRDGDAAEAVTAYFLDNLEPREMLGLEYELYLAAVSVPALRHLAVEWFDVVAGAIDIVVRDRAVSFALAALLDGYFIHAIVAGTERFADTDRVRASVRALIEGGAPTSS